MCAAVLELTIVQKGFRFMEVFVFSRGYFTILRCCHVHSGVSVCVCVCVCVRVRVRACVVCTILLNQFNTFTVVFLCVLFDA
jgi:hypothetical protein